MSESDRWALPARIHHLLRLVALKYQKAGKDSLRKLVVNASCSVAECTTYDNWNGGTAGHDVELIVPEELFAEIIENKDKTESKILSDLNSLNDIENEHVRRVIVGVKHEDDFDWKLAHDDVLLRKIKNVSSSTVKRIWGESGVRLFMSHKIEFKKQAEELKETLKGYGIVSFVAHTSIRPTQEWLREIENALLTMDAFVALLTENFRESQWTDQEVGFALCRGVPIISISLTGEDPHGFMSKDQKMLGSWEDIPGMAGNIFSILSEKPAFGEKLKDAAIEAFVKAPSFFESMHFVQKILPSIKFLTERQIDKIKQGYADNNQLNGCYVVNKGLVNSLYEIAGKKYRIENKQLLEINKEIGSYS